MYMYVYAYVVLRVVECITTDVFYNSEHFRNVALIDGNIRVDLATDQPEIC